MSMEYIRKTYGVPAKRGAAIEFRGNIGPTPMRGVIIGSLDGKLRVRMDNETVTRILHPTWEIKYLPPSSEGDTK